MVLWCALVLVSRSRREVAGCARMTPLSVALCRWPPAMDREVIKPADFNADRSIVVVKNVPKGK